MRLALAKAVTMPCVHTCERRWPDNATALVVDVVDPRNSENLDVDLPRHERPGARALWPAAKSLRAPLWPWLVLLASAGLMGFWAVRLGGVDPLRWFGL